MKPDAGSRAIQCRNCGAPLPLHGGHRIRTLVCEYCGAQMDVRKDYAVLARFSEQVAPYTPLRLGMSGEIDGVAFTVVGMLAWSADGDTWVDSLLFSPTHGYAWMSYQQGHFLFLRRVRDLPDKDLWHLSTREAFRARGETFRFYESYRATITYVAGELTWIATRGDESWQAEGIAPPLLYGAERSEHESEYFLGEYFAPDDVYEAFAIEGRPRKRIGVHPAQPVPDKPWRELSRIARPFVGLALLLLLMVVFFFGGRLLLAEKVTPASARAGHMTPSFEVSDADKLLKLVLESEQNNSWVDVEVAMVRARTGEEVFSFQREISYYHGVESGESWSEGSQRATALFKAPAAGEYSLRIRMPAGSVRQGLYVELYEGYVGRRYFVLLLILFLIMALAWPVRRWVFEAKRWQPVSGEDD